MNSLPAEIVTRRRAELEFYVPSASGLPTSPTSVVPLDGARVVIGRARDSDVVLSETSIARRHAVFECDGRGWTIEDLGSTNGVLHGGRRIGRARVSPGDEFDLGRVRIRFREARVEEPRCPALIERICAAPDEEPGWQVYADWLLERGAALGPSSLGRFSQLPPDRARLQWRCGLLASAQLTVRPGAPDWLPAILAWLSAVSSASALGRLSLRIAAPASVTQPGEWARERFAQVRDAFALGTWPALTRLDVGPVWGDGLAPIVSGALEGLRAWCPRLRGPPASWVSVHRQAWLDIDRPWPLAGPGRGLRGRVPLTQAVQLGPLRFTPGDFGWVVQAAPAERRVWTVNEHWGPADGQGLLPGDVVAVDGKAVGHTDFRAIYGAA